MFLSRHTKKYVIFFGMLFFIVTIFPCSDITSSNKISLNNKKSYTLYVSKYEVKVSRPLAKVPVH